MISGGSAALSMTVIVSWRANVPPLPSETCTRIEWLGFDSKSRTAAVRSWSPAVANVPLSSPPAPATSENASVSPGLGSVAESVPTVVPVG